jgi:hypothetical protein
MSRRTLAQSLSALSSVRGCVKIRGAMIMQGRPMSWIRHQVQRIPLPTNPGGLVYGAILSATLISAEYAKAEKYGRALGGIVIAEIIYWLALSYSEFAGDRAKTGDPFEFKGFLRSARHELAVVLSGIPPFVVIVVCWIAGATLTTALTIGVYTAAGMIVLSELVIGISTEETGRELVVDLLVGVLFGILVVAIKVLLH